MAGEKITINSAVKAPVEKVWELWTQPEHIKNWNNASEDWHTPHAENDLRKGGKFLSRMEARDGSFGFDFEGVYDEVIELQRIEYTIADGRKVETNFEEKNGETHIKTTFEAESENSVEMQKEGWQAILDNFKNYAENDQNGGS